MRRQLALSFGACLILGLAGCSSNSETPKDLGTKKETGTPPPALTCKADKSDCKDFVMNKIIMPIKDAAKYGLQKDNKSYNALGDILGALANLAPTMNFQDSVDQSVNSGKTIILMRIQAGDLMNEPNAAGQTWVGAETACCPTAGDDRPKCADEAAKTCFNPAKASSFKVGSSSPKDATFAGKIAAGNMSCSASKLQLTLALSSAPTVPPLSLNLIGVQVRGTLAASGTSITDGVLAGAATQAEVDNNLIPTVAKMLSATLSDPTVQKTTKDAIITIFDTSPTDGKIDVKEVSDNKLIKSFLTPDVDGDGDGIPELLSLGIGYNALSAIIEAQ
jgi:hypothetical protein